MPPAPKCTKTVSWELLRRFAPLPDPSDPEETPHRPSSDLPRTLFRPCYFPVSRMDILLFSGHRLSSEHFHWEMEAAKGIPLDGHATCTCYLRTSCVFFTRFCKVTTHRMRVLQFPINQFPKQRWRRKACISISIDWKSS